MEIKVLKERSDDVSGGWAMIGKDLNIFCQKNIGIIILASMFKNWVGILYLPLGGITF